MRMAATHFKEPIEPMTLGNMRAPRSAAMFGERRLDRQANDEPSLAMSFAWLTTLAVAPAIHWACPRGRVGSPPVGVAPGADLCSR
jgi:hypothetical protein